MNPVSQAPSQGAPAPQGQPPQNKPPGGTSPAEQLISGVYQGLQQIKQLLASAGQSLPAEDHQLFDNILKLYEQFVSSLKGAGQAPAQPQAPQQRAPQQSGPMAAHASKNATPAGY